MSTRNRMEVYEARNRSRRNRASQNTISGLFVKGFVIGLAFAIAFIVVMTLFGKLVHTFNNKFVESNGHYYYKTSLIDNATTCAVKRPVVEMPEIDMLVFEDTEASVQYSEAPETEDSSEIIETTFIQEEVVDEVVVETTTVEENNDPYFGWTEEDYQYLLMCIVGEAQNCSEKHQMYVGSVVLNRVASTKYFTYAHTIKQAALGEGQYTSFEDGNAYRTPTETNKRVAMELLKNGSILPSNVLFQSQEPQGDGIYEIIGNTYFCYKD